MTIQSDRYPGKILYWCSWLPFAKVCKTWISVRICPKVTSYMCFNFRYLACCKEMKVAFATVTAHWPVGIASPVGGHTSARLKCGCECSVNLTPLDHPGVRQSAWQLGSSQPDHITARQRKQGNQPDNSEAVSLTTSQGIHWCQAPCSDGCSAVQ